MDIKDLKNEKLKVEFEIADIIRQFEKKSETTVTGIFVNNISMLTEEINKSVTLGLDIN